MGRTKSEKAIKYHNEIVSKLNATEILDLVELLSHEIGIY